MTVDPSAPEQSLGQHEDGARATSSRPPEHGAKQRPLGAPPPSWLKAAGDWGFQVSFATLAVGIVLWGLLQIRAAVMPVLIALLLATLVSPATSWFSKLKLPRAPAAALALLLLLAALGGLGTLVGFAIAGEMGQLGPSLQRGYENLVELTAGALGSEPEKLKAWADAQLSKVQSSAWAQNAMTQLAGMMEGLTVLVLSIVFTFLFAWSGKQQFLGLVRFLPPHKQAGARDLGARVWETLGGYMRGVFVIATADSLLLGLGYWLAGMPLVGALMLLMFLGAFVPFVGPLIAGGAAVLVGFADGGASMAALAAGIAFLVQQIEGNLLQPFVMGRAVELHPSVVLFAVTAGGILGGVVGVFLAVPIAASLATVFFYVQERAERRRLRSAAESEDGSPGNGSADPRAEQHESTAEANDA